ncbi:YcjF family protein [Martelella endophytica]|uniref:Membrane protein n=1 Tax=Martelella endophytica TaxID=1486262 RepID=A0A0D5LSF3_MAREN|nr:TIGR01620 family protein [Martelella endophytica]AJY46712.1 membrane protein [Martelella endophytica]
MSTNDPRRPAAFDVGDDRPHRNEEAPRQPRHFDDPSIHVTPDDEDPFLRGDTEIAADELDPPVAVMKKRGFSFTKLAMAAFSIVLTLALGLWIDDLVRSLFARAPWLGWLALGAVGVGVFAGLVVAARETIAILRLGAIQHIKVKIAEAQAGNDARQARKAAAELSAFLAGKAETARGRKRLAELDDEVVDAPELIGFCEREMMGPLDLKARALILNASKRVSVVTAISPRAAVDLIYVFYESIRLVRNMAELYGGRPGSLGLFRLVRDVLAHLAVTGSIAVGDSLVQQVLGHGLASKLSARFGEGLINGLMTARIGIAAMDLCRPMPFNALKRPSMADFISDLGPGTKRDLSKP